MLKVLMIIMTKWRIDVLCLSGKCFVIWKAFYLSKVLFHRESVFDNTVFKS